MQKTSTARARTQAGSTAIEAALVTTVLFMIVFGVVEFSRAMFAFNQLAYLAQDGARWASVRGSSVATPATAASIQSYVQGNAVGISPPTVTTTWQNNLNSPGNWVNVQVSYPLTFVAPYMPTRTLNMSASSQMTILR